jgi:spermidine synthase
MKFTKSAPQFEPLTISEGDGLRYLHFNTPWVQGGMRIGQPLTLELEYARRMMVWMLFCTLEDLPYKHAVQLGLGAASLTKFCRKVLQMPTTAVEFNPQVVQACQYWFELGLDDPDLRIVLQDAAEYVNLPQVAQTADILSVDLYDHEAASPVLDTQEFYAGCHRLLGQSGMMTVNLFGKNSSFDRSKAKIAEVFGAHRVHNLPPSAEGNTIVWATKRNCLFDFQSVVENAHRIEEQYQLPATQWLPMVKEWKNIFIDS